MIHAIRFSNLRKNIHRSEPLPRLIVYTFYHRPRLSLLLSDNWGRTMSPVYKSVNLCQNLFFDGNMMKVSRLLNVYVLNIFRRKLFGIRSGLLLWEEMFYEYKLCILSFYLSGSKVKLQSRSRDISDNRFFWLSQKLNNYMMLFFTYWNILVLFKFILFIEVSLLFQLSIFRIVF